MADARREARHDFHTIRQSPISTNCIYNILVLTYMIDHAKGYRALHRQLDAAHKKPTGGSTTLFNKITGFQFEMQSVTQDIIPDPMKNIHGLCKINLEYSVHAMMQLEYGNLYVCSNTIRPIFESIPKMFYLLRYPKYIIRLICKEDFNYWRASQDSANIKSLLDAYIIARRGRMLIDDDEFAVGVSCKDFKKMVTNRKKFTPKWYRNKIYTSKSLKNRDRSYGLLSVSSHASFVRSYTTPSPKVLARYPKILAELAFFNLLINANASAKVLKKIGEFDCAKNFILKTYDELGGFHIGSALYPDQTTYISKLEIKLPRK